MATDLYNYIPNRPGLDSGGEVTPRLMVNPAEGQLGYHSANILASMDGKALSYGFGGMIPYVAARVTETKDNSSTIAYAGSGVKFQTQATPTDNDDIVINSLETITLAAGKIYKLSMDVNISSVANLGFTAGFITSGSTEIYTAAPADGVYLIKAKNAATVILRVVENSGTAADSATILTMTDATRALISFEFYCGASAAASWGNVYVNGTKTAFTGTQLTGLFNMVNTTAPTLAAHLGFRVNSTTQRNAVVSHFLAEADR